MEAQIFSFSRILDGGFIGFDNDDKLFISKNRFWSSSMYELNIVQVKYIFCKHVCIRFYLSELRVCFIPKNRKYVIDKL